MGQKLVVGPYNRGLRNDVTPFNVDNGSFPTLINAYQWRGRIKRKRGTTLLGRLQRFFDSTSLSYNSGNSTFTLDGGGDGNILNNTGWNLLAATASPNATPVPGSVVITDTNTATVFTDPAKNGTLSPSGTINYSTGAITIAAAAGDPVNVKMLYNPNLPVMGLRDFIGNNAVYPGTIAFDTKFSYNINTTNPYPIYDVSFYKNPLATASLPNYVQKTIVTPTSWNGQDYQQFYTTNYQGAFWAANGTQNPFVTTGIGMQFAPASTISAVSVAAGPPQTITMTITNCPLIIGDFVFFNEWTSSGGGDATKLNLQSGYVTACAPNTPPLASKTVTITLPNASLPAGTYTPGIVQYLTTRVDSTVDCIRWYDGDPTNGSATAPILNGNLGWVNYTPPLSNFAFSIGGLPPAIYYLVGAEVIVPFKDRLLFFGPVVQTSSAGSQVFLQDTVIYTQNGSPYYTASFTGTIFNPTNIIPILVPVNQTGSPTAVISDSPGFGGFVSAAIDQRIATVGPNEDVLIVGFTRAQAQLVYTANNYIPFSFYLINSELGADSTFSAVVMDKGIYSIGSRGVVMTSQVESQRIDLEIPDMAFQIQETNNGALRICAQRDYINEWIYFTTPRTSSKSVYPTQTLQYNYRDNSWAQFFESYTTYGLFRQQTGYTWATIPFLTWNDWNVPWDAGSASLLKPLVIGGNQQGFVMFRDQGTQEGTSLYISNIVGNVVTAPNHCLDNDDYVSFLGVLGSANPVNGIPYQVTVIDNDNFLIGPTSPPGFTYLGGGTIIRYYTPYIQTRQFPTSWEMARKTRIGMQQYLLTTTTNSQITLLIFLSQDADSAYNNFEFPDPVEIVPETNSMNDSLIYSTVLFTCPESTNLGLTPANTNLQMPTAQTQSQIWHRINTSLIGDTVQLGFTMNSAQMLDLALINQTAEIELHAFIIDLQPSQMLA